MIGIRQICRIKGLKRIYETFNSKNLTKPNLFSGGGIGVAPGDGDILLFEGRPDLVLQVIGDVA